MDDSLSDEFKGYILQYEISFVEEVALLEETISWDFL